MSVWLSAFLSTITCAADVRMVHARPFSTFTLQDLSNSIKNTSRRGVLTSTIELWSYGSPKGLLVPIFGSANLIFTLASKWGCDTLLGLGGSHHLPPYSIFCTSPRGPHPNDFSFPRLSSGSPEIAPNGTPATLEPHSFASRPWIEM